MDFKLFLTQNCPRGSFSKMGERESKRDFNCLQPKEIQPWEFPLLSDEKFVELIRWQMAKKIEELAGNGLEAKCASCQELIKNPENLRRLLGKSYDSCCFKEAVDQFSQRADESNPVDRLILLTAKRTIKLESSISSQPLT